MATDEIGALTAGLKHRKDVVKQLVSGPAGDPLARYPTLPTQKLLQADLSRVNRFVRGIHDLSL